jgi:hypothetical protein
MVDKLFLGKCEHGIVELLTTDAAFKVRERKVCSQDDDEFVVWSLIHRDDDMIALSLPFCALCPTNRMS